MVKAGDHMTDSYLEKISIVTGKEVAADQLGLVNAKQHDTQQKGSGTTVRPQATNQDGKGTGNDDAHVYNTAGVPDGGGLDDSSSSSSDEKEGTRRAAKGSAA